MSVDGYYYLTWIYLLLPLTCLYIRVRDLDVGCDFNVSVRVPHLSVCCVEPTREKKKERKRKKES